MKKIPDNAKKVFEGIIFDVYQWDQEMFDGSKTVFEMIKRRESSAVVAVSDNNIIINHEEQPTKKPFIAIPGGLCEKDESDPLLNAKRELVEETGFESDDWMFWFTADPFNNSKAEWNNHFFIAKNAKKTHDQKLDPGEKITTRLITFEEFLNLADDPTFRNKDLIPILQKAKESEEEKQKLKDLLGITT